MPKRKRSSIIFFHDDNSFPIGKVKNKVLLGQAFAMIVWMLILLTLCFVTTGGDVWVLVIVNTTKNDSKVYRCEVNGDPPVQSFHPLQGNQIESKAHINLMRFSICRKIPIMVSLCRWSYTIISRMLCEFQ